MTTVRLFVTAIASMEIESRRSHPNESGGLLIGVDDADGMRVEVATGPGPDAIHTPTYFRRDGAFTQAELDRHYAASEGRIDYVGEWHSHGLPIGPSPRDRRSMGWVAVNQKYSRGSPTLIIMQRRGRDCWRAVGFRWLHDRLRRANVAIIQDR